MDDGLRWLAHTLRCFRMPSTAIQYQFAATSVATGLHRWRVSPASGVVLLSRRAVDQVNDAGLLLALLLLTQPRSLCTSVGLATILLLVFSLNCRVQIGIRLVFPLVASCFWHWRPGWHAESPSKT